jgi:hypothetical protein
MSFLTLGNPPRRDLFRPPPPIAKRILRALIVYLFLVATQGGRIEQSLEGRSTTPIESG